MYRINLYRDRELEGQVRRKSAARASVIGLIVGAQVLLIGFLAISGSLLRERASALETSIAALPTSEAPAVNPELTLARAVISERLNRIDWSAKLAAVGETVPDPIVVSRVQVGKRLDQNRYPGINIEGRVIGARGDIGPVLDFVERLREHPAIAGDFPVVDLETSDARQSQNFRIICRKRSQPNEGTPQG